MNAILCNANFFMTASFPVEVTSAIAPTPERAGVLLVVAPDIYSLPWETLARFCRVWLPVVAIGATSRAVTPLRVVDGEIHARPMRALP
jgi:hypothetical protein